MRNLRQEIRKIIREEQYKSSAQAFGHMPYSVFTKIMRVNKKYPGVANRAAFAMDLLDSIGQRILDVELIQRTLVFETTSGYYMDMDITTGRLTYNDKLVRSERDIKRIHSSSL